MRFAEQQERFHPAQTPVDIGLVALIFEVFGRTHATHDERCLLAAGQIDGQVAVGHDLHPPVTGIEIGNGPHPLGHIAVGVFESAHGHTDDQPVEKRQGAVYDGPVTDGKRVECARKKACFHH